MKLALTLGAAALALFATAAIAEDYVGGAIKTTEIGGKEVLVGANDMTLYTYDKDAVGVTNCYDKCAENWPPLIADAGAKPDGDFTLVDRTDGSKMWAYGGKPLYTFLKDAKGGDKTGDGAGGVWHIATED